MLCQFLLYNKVNQLCVYIYPHIPSLFHLPPATPIPPLYGGTKHQADLPVQCSCLPLATYFTFGSVYMSMLLSHFVPAYPSHPVSSSPFSMSVSLFLSCPQVHQNHCFILQIPYICVSIQYFLFLFLTYFTLHDRLQVQPPNYK